MRHSNRLLWHQSPEIIVSNILWIKPVWTVNKFWSSRRVYIRISISCLKAAFLLVSIMNRDHLWEGPTPEVPDSRTLPWLCPCSCWDYKTSSPRMIRNLGSFPGPSQRSRFLVLTKRSAASVDENDSHPKFNTCNLYMQIWNFLSQKSMADYVTFQTRSHV